MIDEIRNVLNNWIDVPVKLKMLDNYLISLGYKHPGTDNKWKKGDTKAMVSEIRSNIIGHKKDYPSIGETAQELTERFVKNIMSDIEINPTSTDTENTAKLLAWKLDFCSKPKAEVIIEPAVPELLLYPPLQIDGELIYPFTTWLTQEVKEFIKLYPKHKKVLDLQKRMRLRTKTEKDTEWL